MSSIKCCEKPGTQLQSRILRLLKVAKPVLRLMTKKQRTNAVTPSTCNYHVEESLQNDANESELFRLEFKFFEGTDGDEVLDNAKNEELEKRLRAESEATGEAPRKADLHSYVPVRPASPLFPGRIPEKLCFAPSTDLDVCKRGGGFLTCRQVAERQVPAAV